MTGAFADKTIVVTGSGKQKGLGQGILKTFARAARRWRQSPATCRTRINAAP
jgi:NAD(P)-dependent dehydrogenase (short-subunit alcohol dehydrogenase family)